MGFERAVCVVLAAAALSSCAGSHIKAPAVCDGKHRRPANLYGTILPTLPVPLPPSQSGGQSAVAPGGGSGGTASPVPPVPKPQAAPGPDGATESSSSPGPGAANAITGGPGLSQRDFALSYFDC
jgi:hypothetical protein